MKVDLEKYSNKRICVAVSGGKDSMALLHYILKHGAKFGVSLSALNCDHGMRGEQSGRDSAFVRQYCGDNGIPVYSFAAGKGDLKDEVGARAWRLFCYSQIIEGGKADCVATAHHLNDNAETVLFNLARGAALSGMTGIADVPALGLIRPLISCTRGEIDEYIEANRIPFVTDETNLTDGYTRNKIRHNVLPALEQAVSGAAGNIYRFSRLAAEDEEYFLRKTEEFILKRSAGNYLILPCGERVIFRRAAQRIISLYFNKKDYTARHLGTLFDLQSAPNGKRFFFLGLIAVKEAGGVAVYCGSESADVPFYGVYNSSSQGGSVGVLYCGDESAKPQNVGAGARTLRFDAAKIPQDAVIRFKKEGDKFTKFGGGTKSLADYLTDKKIPQSLRASLPLVCVGSEVLIVGGVEISDRVKLTEGTQRTGVFICGDPLADF